MDWDDVRVFLAVARHGSLRAAGRALGLSQPTISHHMAKLNEVGLVESEKRGIWVYYRLRADLAPATRKLLAQLIG